MASTRANHQLGKTAAILIGGLIIGVLLRDQGSGTASAGKAPPDTLQNQTVHDASAPASSSGSTKRKDRELPAGTVTFSPLQWSQIVKDPKAWRISLSDCAPGPMETLNDIPLIGRLFQAGERGPSLDRHAKLFGWDQAREKEVREMLFQFGGQVERLQDEVARVSYPGDGKVLIDYSAGNERLRNLIADLEKGVENLIGPRDAARFMLLTSIPSWENPSRELSVSAAPDGKSLTVEGFDGGADAQIDAGDDEAGKIRSFLLLGQGQAPEGIDWQELVREANLKNSTSP